MAYDKALTNDIIDILEKGNTYTLEYWLDNNVNYWHISQFVRYTTQKTLKGLLFSPAQ